MGKLPSPETESTKALAVDDMFSSRMDKLRLRHLRLLDWVARTGSLSAAAQALGMSQPGATKMLKELELALGCLLIERSAKGGELTEAGQHVLDRLRISLHSLRTARESIESRKELPLVRLGILALVGIQALSQVVGAMQAEKNLPRLQIEMGTVNSLLESLNDGRVDCVVGFLDEATALSNIPRLQVTPLWQENLVIVASRKHPLASRKKVSLKMASEFEWVMMPKSSANRRALDRLFLTAGMAPPAPHIETASFHIGLSIVASSQMLTAAPESAYLQYKSQVCVLPIEASFPSTTLVFMTRSEGPMLPAVHMLSQQFQTYAETLKS